MSPSLFNSKVTITLRAHRRLRPIPLVRGCAATTRPEATRDRRSCSGVRPRRLKSVRGLRVFWTTTPDDDGHCRSSRQRAVPDPAPDRYSSVNTCVGVYPADAARSPCRPPCGAYIPIHMHSRRSHLYAYMLTDNIPSDIPRRSWLQHTADMYAYCAAERPGNHVDILYF